MKDYYKILGVTKNSDENEIKKAYRKLVRKYHPDRNPGDKEAEKKFLEISEAYEVLGTESKRNEYNEMFENQGKRREETSKKTKSTAQQPFSFNQNDFNNMFDSFFSKATDKKKTGEDDKMKKQVNNMFNSYFMGGKK